MNFKNFFPLLALLFLLLAAAFFFAPLFEKLSETSPAKAIFFYGLSLTAVYCLLAYLWMSRFFRRLRGIIAYSRRKPEAKEETRPSYFSEGIFKELVRVVDESSGQMGRVVEKTLREQERSSAILASMSEGVVAIDTDKKIILFNEALCKVFDFQAEEVRNRYFWEVFRDNEINRMIEACLSERRPFQREHSVLLTGATFQIHLSPVFYRKSFLGAAVVFYDVTKLKQFEKLRTEFVQNVSHELKTPLTSIMGFVETLKEGAIEDKNNRGKFLKIIEQHSKHLHRLVEDILLLSKVESGKWGAKKEPVDVGGLLKQLLEWHRKSIQSQEVTVDWKTSPEPLVLSADPQALQQILSNLLDNAVKYNKPKGKVVIRATQHPKEVLLEVKDTGIGIPQEELPRIFERFHRVDKSRSREMGGTGLGLAITKHLVERNGGSIRAASDVGKGSTFTASFPV